MDSGGWGALAPFLVRPVLSLRWLGRRGESALGPSFLTSARSVPQQEAEPGVLRQTDPDRGPVLPRGLRCIDALLCAPLSCLCSGDNNSYLLKKNVLIYLTALDLSCCGIRDHVP